MKFPFLFAQAIVCLQMIACHTIPTTLPITNIDSIVKPIWSMQRAGGSISNGYFPQFMYKKSLITYGENNSKAQIYSLDINSGKVEWLWDDTFDSHGARTNQVHVDNNILVWRNTRKVYAVNLDDGKTLWKKNIITELGFNTDDMTGIGTYFLFHTSRPSYFSGQTKTGEIEASPKLNITNRTFHSRLAMFVNTPPNIVYSITTKDTLAVLPYGTIDGEDANFFTIYNLTKNQEIYTKTIPGDTSGAFSYPPLVHSGKIYFPSGAFILCFDLKTGNELWRTRFRSIFFTSGIMIANNKIFCNNNDGFSYCLDPENGKAIWKTATRSGGSLPFLMNDVLYFTSEADGHLYGLDANDGKILMKIEDPRGGIGFQDVVTGTGDKIFAATYTTLYCFKAAR